MPIDSRAPPDKPEVAQMVVIHKALRRETDLLPAVVSDVECQDTGRARAISEHIGLVLSFLHDHHTSEDHVLWPVMETRVPMDRRLIDAMEQQHRTISDLIKVVEPDLTDWPLGADSVTRRRIADGLDSLSTSLGDHLDMEEAEILPLVHEHLTVDEWNALEQYARDHLPRSAQDRLLMLGMILEDATPAEHDWYAGELPSVARMLWRFGGRTMYNSYTRTIRRDA